MLDLAGVGKLIQMACELGRRTRPDLKLGICGEHGGEPAAVAFCDRLGVNYVCALRSGFPSLASPRPRRHWPPGARWIAPAPPSSYRRVMTQPLVGIVMGSDSDWEVMQHAAGRLAEFGVPHERRIVSGAPELVVLLHVGPATASQPARRRPHPLDRQRRGAAGGRDPAEPVRAASRR